jgi:calcium-dependent protein kinase
MASQMITEKEKDDLKKLFRSVDKNGDGRLSKAELTEAFRAATIEQNRFVENLDERIQQIVDCVDINKSGVIDYTEFIIAGLEQEKLLTENKIR